MANHADIVEMLIDNYGVDVHSKDEVRMAHMHVHTIKPVFQGGKFS